MSGQDRAGTKGRADHENAVIAVSGTALVEFGTAAPGGLPSIQQIWP